MDPVGDVQVLEVLLVEQDQCAAVHAVVAEDSHILFQPYPPKEQRHLETDRRVELWCEQYSFSWWRDIGVQSGRSHSERHTQFNAIIRKLD
jgi:hypothetical protein